MHDSKKREKFSSGLAVFFATLGSAVGLGNIWKFPYLVGNNGGGGFLFIYLLCVFFVGLPILISEFFIGRKARKNFIGAIEYLKPDSIWRNMGLVGIVAVHFIIFFYTCVAGWVYSYIFKSIKGDFNYTSIESTRKIFFHTTIGPVEPLIWQAIVIVIVSSILLMGVKKGIERVTKILMPVLFILIIVCDIKALTLSGAKEGIKFLFNINFSKLNTSSVLMALGLSFFKLSLGMGVMVTYGSYFTEDNNMPSTAVKVILSDTLVSLLAGIAVFPVVFSFNVKPSEGPGLLFMTIPLVFSKMAFGKLLLSIFFILTAIAATTALLSMMEGIIIYYIEERGYSRKKAVLLNGIVLFMFGALATLSADKNSILSNIKILHKGFFDLFDYLASNILAPLGGIFISLFIGYVLKGKDIKMELSNNGSLKNKGIVELYYFAIKYITPILLILVFLYSIRII
ncbi:sodium-dependent transporter [Clostridium rectalis]|uniref:sodium-dependent transporter n=1 Tax=Clostridium rectalis TaxID=2040295 RepID=UPI000F645149|nr:sodium-dependent transporter [Clostridium rectalis]